MRCTCFPALLLAVACTTANRSDVTRFFLDKGTPTGWVVRQMKDESQPAAPDARWFVNRDGILTGSRTYDTWLLSEKEYADFELELELKLPPLGNSGVALRAPLHGDPAYQGMELQIADPRYYEGKGAPEQSCGAIYRAIAPDKDAFKPDDWNKLQITCQGPRVKVALNGKTVQDFNLDEQTKPLRRDAADKTASPLKERPRKGHIGFQELSRGGRRVQIRNVRLRVLRGI